MYEPEPPRRPSGARRPSRRAFLIAAPVLNPQYCAASVVVMGASRAQLDTRAADDEAWTVPSTRSSCCTASRIKPRRIVSSVIFRLQAVFPRVVGRIGRLVACAVGRAPSPQSLGQRCCELRRRRAPPTVEATIRLASRGRLLQAFAGSAIVTEAPMVREATPSNVPGDFYVAKGECITCMAPEAEAPDLMAFDETESSCFFRRQPTTPDELDRAIRAVWASCCRAVRYRGSDTNVQRRLADHGDLESIDVPVGRLVDGPAR